PFKILSEEILLELARALPADTAALATVRGVTPRVIGRWGQALLAAVHRAQGLDERALPQWPRRPRPSVPGAVSRRVEALRKWRAASTERLGLEPGLLLPNRLISVIAEAAPRSTACAAGAPSTSAANSLQRSSAREIVTGRWTTEPFSSRTTRVSRESFATCVRSPCSAPRPK